MTKEEEQRMVRDFTFDWTDHIEDLKEDLAQAMYEYADDMGYYTGDPEDFMHDIAPRLLEQSFRAAIKNIKF